MKKKLLSLTLALLLCLGLLPLTGVAAEIVGLSGTCGENLSWALDREGTLTISGTGAMDDYESGWHQPLNSPWAFWVKDVKAVVIEDGVTRIGNLAFQQCENLISVSIPDSMTAIGNSAFGYCAALTTVDIPDSVTEIGSGAFIYSGLTAFTLPSGVTKISDSMFSSTELTSFDIPVQVTEIADLAFSGCKQLTHVTIPNSVTSIGYRAFVSCGALTEVTIPASATELGEDLFVHCDSLTRIEVETENPAYCSVDGVLFDHDMTTLLSYPMNKEQTTYAIPDGVTKVERSAFANHAHLTSIRIPDSVVEIGREAFAYNAHLTSMDIPDSVVNIGDEAFCACSGLTNLNLGKGVASLGMWAISSCPSLLEINVDPENMTYTSVDGVLFTRDMTTLLEYPASKPDTAYTVPKGVVKIGGTQGTFNRCINLTSVVIPEGVTTIEDSSFTNCINLTSVVLPSSLTSVEALSFMSETDVVDSYAATPGLTIYGTASSRAQIYAIQNDILFVEGGAAYASTQTVQVDGNPVTFQTYALLDANGNQTNYIKLRDLADILNGSAAQFEVGWDGAISITTGTTYTPNGSEQNTPFSGDRGYEVLGQPVLLNGQSTNLNGVKLTDAQGGGYSYYQLRDLGRNLGFNVGWNGSSIVIETNKPYTDAD